MADCPPGTTISQTPSYGHLSEEEFMLCQIGLLLQWVGTVDPGLDVSPAAVLERGKQFQGLDDQGMDLAEIQILCNIASA